jgi:AcrB/AcrD/AcrF family
VLLFEFRTLAAPLSILASAILSVSGVVLAPLITQTDFNIASFMGLIMVIGIVAKNGILLLDADQKFRDVGFSAEHSVIQADSSENKAAEACARAEEQLKHWDNFPVTERPGRSSRRRRNYRLRWLRGNLEQRGVP